MLLTFYFTLQNWCFAWGQKKFETPCLLNPCSRSQETESQGAEMRSLIARKGEDSAEEAGLEQGGGGVIGLQNLHL